jgi:prepilin-type N-terminal cleavage/methylation domain-containing protein
MILVIIPMKRIPLNFSRGFTLVELMVVVSIIGILSAVVYANFGTSRQIARDNVRKTDLKNLQLAIELYKAQNGVYPLGCNGTGSPVSWSGNVNGSYACSDGSTEYIVGLVPDFIAALPVDPKASTYAVGSNFGYVYGASSNQKEYKLMAAGVVEVLQVQSYSDEFARCPAQGGTQGCTGAVTKSAV